MKKKKKTFQERWNLSAFNFKSTSIQKHWNSTRRWIFWNIFPKNACYFNYKFQFNGVRQLFTVFYKTPCTAVICSSKNTHSYLPNLMLQLGGNFKINKLKATKTSAFNLSAVAMLCSPTAQLPPTQSPAPCRWCLPGLSFALPPLLIIY